MSFRKQVKLILPEMGSTRNSISKFINKFALGLATLKVRVPNKITGTRLLTVQSKLDVPAEGLYESIANQLGIPTTK